MQVLRGTTHFEISYALSEITRNGTTVIVWVLHQLLDRKSKRIPRSLFVQFVQVHVLWLIIALLLQLFFIPAHSARIFNGEIRMVKPYVS